jgi:hypothetical protein
MANKVGIQINSVTLAPYLDLFKSNIPDTSDTPGIPPARADWQSIKKFS